MPERIEQLLEYLINPETPIPIERLHELSDLDSDQMALLRQKWDLLDLQKRRSLIKELGQLADDNFELSYEVINKFALNDQDPEVRQTAINNLWESKDTSLVHAFIQALEADPFETVRASAASALGSFVLIAETEDIAPSLKLDIEEALLHSMNIEKNERILCSCLESLGFSSRKEVGELILDAYHSDHVDMKKSSLLAMGRSANKKWGDLVMPELHNPLPKLRYVAAKAAGELEIREAMSDLVELLDDVNQEVKHAAIWSISQIGGPAATEALVSLFDLCDVEEEIQLIQDALDNLAFVNDTRDFLLFDFDETEDYDS
jgi:HEAT repeat protein